MSQENVESVEWLMSEDLADFAGLVRDDARWGAWIQWIAPVFDPEWEIVRRGVLDSSDVHVGFAGSRALWLNWLAPWESYTVEFEEAIDCGDQVLALSHDRARPRGSEGEVVLAAPAGVWTFRDGKIVRFDIYEDRAEARKAVGLEE